MYSGSKSDTKNEDIKNSENLLRRELSILTLLCEAETTYDSLAYKSPLLTKVSPPRRVSSV